MYWLSRLAELGHSIVGIEASTIPIEEFFNERNLQYTVEVCEQIPGQLYKVSTYNCNTYIIGELYCIFYRWHSPDADVVHVLLNIYILWAIHVPEIKLYYYYYYYYFNKLCFLI